jgi:hypothetical protein
LGYPENKVSFAYDPSLAKVVPRDLRIKIHEKSSTYLHEENSTGYGQVSIFCQLTRYSLAKRPNGRVYKKAEEVFRRSGERVKGITSIELYI